MQRVEKNCERHQSVLIVDDSPSIRQIVARAFASAGFEICGEANNGREAIEQAQHFKPELILLDFSMPVMNGLQAAPELRKNAPETRIILFTLYSNSLLERHAHDVGVDSVISKSEALSVLIDKAQSLLDS